MVRNVSCGREGICAKNHEQWPPEFTISNRAARFFQRLDHVARVEQPRLDLEHVAVGFRIADARSHRIAFASSGSGSATPPSTPRLPDVRRPQVDDAPTSWP